MMYPSLKVNNKTEKTLAVINGKNIEVIVPAEPGFLIKTKTDAGEYIEEFLAKEFEAQIVMVRYKVESPYQAKERYNSNEFDSFDGKEKVTVYADKKAIFSGTYRQAKERFATDKKDFKGNPKPEFTLKIVFYIKMGNDYLKLEKRFDKSIMNFINSFDGSPVSAYNVKFGTEVVNVAGSDKNVLRLEKTTDADPFNAEDFKDKFLNDKNNKNTNIKNVPMENQNDDFLNSLKKDNTEDEEKFPSDIIPF